MNRVSHTLLRIVCCMKGHRPFPERDIKQPPSQLTPFPSIGSLGAPVTLSNAAVTAMPLANNSMWKAPDVNFNLGPVTATAAICSRCWGVYWQNTLKGSYFVDSSRLPELQPYLNWQSRQSWEETARAQNELANKLYQQYQVALKLGYTDESPDE